ncbi:MAG: MBL fold metallo-hydrolase [Caldilineales bacterium]|nr:MBL fold metallo-hydrolase [Caldilineales bacterium]
MQRERVAADIYVFRSEMYLQVTAGVVVTEEGAVIVDTLPFPKETKALRDFVRRRCPQGVRYVIATHAHADHTYGAYLFPEADLIAHRRCREHMVRFGQQALQQAKHQTPALAEVELRLPTLTFDNTLTLRLGNKTLVLRHSPGHSPDVITVRVKEDKVLFASDTVLPVPYLDLPGGGNIEELRQSLRAIDVGSLENIIQGHGEVLLRGELRNTIQTSLNYLDCLEETVRRHIAEGRSVQELLKHNIEDCGCSRIPLNGMVQRLHQANLYYLYKQLLGEPLLPPVPQGAARRTVGHAS